MEKFADIRKNYTLYNIHNLVEPRLFFLMGLSRSYLMPDEIRVEVRGNDLQK